MDVYSRLKVDERLLEGEEEERHREMSGNGM